MPEVISNTSPLQYLHQLGLLPALHRIAGRITIPTAVRAELDAGRAAGIAVPDPGALDWIVEKVPSGVVSLALVAGLGRGEAEVIRLALEVEDPLLLLDDALGRRTAEGLGLPVRGTLGVLLDAKRRGLIPAVGPALFQLQTLRFRLAPETRDSILELAGETIPARHPPPAS